ncbi:MAG: sigma-70 family RNA polymerase sigma factor [Verrucomicrobiota bacterium]
MPDANDMALLREYATANSEPAFETLVRRHVSLVYSVALRQVGNSAQAEEITQAVFLILARKAARLRPDTVLPGWLHETARFASASFLRGELRRQRREQEAYVQSKLQESTADPAWEQLAPLLDEAIGQLGKADRNAVVLRFFQNKSAREIAAALNVHESAAQKRLNRAVEKLRAWFLKRGVAVSGGALTGALSIHSVHGAPAHLAASVMAVSAKGTAVSSSTLTLIKGALKIMAWTKAKTAVVAGVAAIVGIGTTVALVDALLPSPEIEGTWVATELLGGSGVQAGESPKTRLLLKITKVNGNYQVTGDDVDRGYKDVPVNGFTYKHRHIHAEVTDIPDSFDGTVNLAGTKISGRWKEGKGGSGSLVFTRTDNPPPVPEPLTDDEFAPRAGSNLQGLWQGWIGSGKNAIRFEIKIADPSDGTIRADFYCPDQKAIRQPTSVSYDGATVKLMPMAGYGMFQGELRNGREMSGEWIQGGGHTPTKLTRVK